MAASTEEDPPVPTMTWNSHTNNGTVYVSGSATDLYKGGGKTSANFTDNSQTIKVVHLGPRASRPPHCQPRVLTLSASRL